MDTIAFKNYRCIEESGSLAIKPITILLGANSTGKSSVLKFFPLLKQSASKKTRGTFLWYGPFVDFQDFANVLREGENTMTIRFDLSDVASGYYAFFFNHNLSTIFKTLQVEFEIRKRQKDTSEFLSEVRISFPKCSMFIKYKDSEKIDNITVNDTILEGDGLTLVNKGDFIPICVEQTSKNGLLGLEHIGSQQLQYTLAKVLKNQEQEKFQDKYKEVDSKVRRHLGNFSSLQKSINAYIEDKEHINEICNSYIIENVNVFIFAINQYLEALAERIHYVQPLRAMSQRYYRFSNVDVDEIESDGKNLPMFYASLSNVERQKFNNWLSSILHETQLEIQTTSGFIELKLKEEGKSSHNLVDVGFGYTQILPILILIWKVVYQTKKRTMPIMDIATPTIIAIEQPELHLHPKMQGLFADMLVKVIRQCKQEKLDVRFVIETHSESIVSRLGEQIEQNNPTLADDINIVLFNTSREHNNATEIQSTQFDSRGMLKDWPYNFFTHVY